MFLRGLGNLAPGEAVVYTHWITTLAFLEKGIPYDAIQEFTVDQVNVVTAIMLARQEREQEEEARAYR